MYGIISGKEHLCQLETVVSTFCQPVSVSSWKVFIGGENCVCAFVGGGFVGGHLWVVQVYSCGS
jgi:hypothetical protein